jgi:hypothetical protein
MKFQRIMPATFSPEQEAVWQKQVSVVGHMLTTTKAKTFDELCEEVNSYNRQYFDERFDSEMMSYIALDFVRLLEAGFVSVVETDK